MIVEDLKYSDYENRERKRSKIDPGKTLSKVVSINCPRCKMKLEPLGHLEERQCSNCDLLMIRSGNILECRV